MSAAASVEANVLAARAARSRADGSGPCSTTLLELVRSIGEITDDEREIVATVLHLLHTRQVKLCGILRETSVDEIG